MICCYLVLNDGPFLWTFFGSYLYGPKDAVERQIGMQAADLAVKSETATAAAHAARDGDGDGGY